MPRRSILTKCALRSAMALFLLSTFSCGPRRTPDRWVIPSGYEGWIKIDFVVKNAPPLPVKYGYRSIEVPAGGYVQTSSELLYGWASDRFQYVNGMELRSGGWGDGGNVWGGNYQLEMVCTSSGTNSSCHTTGRSINRCYFIGTEEQFNSAAPCESRPWPPVSDDDRVAIAEKN
jgi:hypothetical protein